MVILTAVHPSVFAAPLSRGISSYSQEQRSASHACTYPDFVMPAPVNDRPLKPESSPLHIETTDGCTSEQSGLQVDCQVCGESTSGVYFGATVCLPCKSFFIRYTTEERSRFRCRNGGHCLINVATRTLCKSCRYQKCLDVGMTRRERPEVLQPEEGQLLCRVCGDISNGVHFGVITCEGCKKFFRRSLREAGGYSCRRAGVCPINPKTRNDCRFCRYVKCVGVGMAVDAIKMGRPKKYEMSIPSSKRKHHHMKPYGTRPDVDNASPVCTPSSSSVLTTYSSNKFQGPQDLSLWRSSEFIQNVYPGTVASTLGYGSNTTLVPKDEEPVLPSPSSKLVDEQVDITRNFMEVDSDIEMHYVLESINGMKLPISLSSPSSNTSDDEPTPSHSSDDSSPNSPGPLVNPVKEEQLLVHKGKLSVDILPVSCPNDFGRQNYNNSYDRIRFMECLLMRRWLQFRDCHPRIPHPDSTLIFDWSRSDHYWMLLPDSRVGFGDGHFAEEQRHILNSIVTPYHEFHTVVNENDPQPLSDWHLPRFDIASFNIWIG